MYTFKQQLVSQDKYPIKCPYEMKVEYITVHDTGNRASALNEIQYMVSNSSEVSFHLAVDENEVIQGLPFNRNSWSCGDGAKGKGNRTSISVEICRPTHEDKSLYQRAEENAVYVVARLLYANQLSIEKLKKHQDWSGKMCPHVLLSENRWHDFKERVNNVLKGIHQGKCSSSLSSGTTVIQINKRDYEVGEKVRVLLSAKTYATGETIKSFVKGSVYEIKRIKANQVLLASINSWVYTKDVEKVKDTMLSINTPFLVEIMGERLYIKHHPDSSSVVVGAVERGEVYTIVEVENGFGKLKSGVGYIHLNEMEVKTK